MGKARAIFCLTHPRACSTAFERVFMTRSDDLVCAHEPFGDAFYYGPERLSPRYEDDEQARKDSNRQNVTYQTVFDNLAQSVGEGKRLFLKDMAYYFMAPDKGAPQLAPSLHSKKRGVGTKNGILNGTTNGTTTGVANGTTNGVSKSAPFPYGTIAEEGNPTVVPAALLEQFHFTFLIRDPHSSISSFWRCCVPPLDDVTGFYEFYPAEAGYDELRRSFEYLIARNRVGPKIAGQVHQQTNGHALNGNNTNIEICLVDADDLLDNPEGIIKAYCASVGLDFKPEMLIWDTDADQDQAEEAFEKWPGWHEDVLYSKRLKPRTHARKSKTEEQWDAEWKEKYGEKGAKIIRETVDRNMADYLYLKQFAMKV